MTTINNQEQTIIVPLGQALQDARRVASLSIDEVAQQLNLGPQTVRDIEGSLDEIIESTKYPVIYLRGYLVNYAKLVALDNVEQFIEYQQLSVSQNKPKNLRSPMIIQPVKKRGKWLWLLFILIVIAGISFAVAQQASLFSTEVISANLAKIKSSTADILVGSDESVAEVNSEIVSQTAEINTADTSVSGEGSVAQVKSDSTPRLSVHSVNSETVSHNAELNTTDTAVGSNESVAETATTTKAAHTAEITSSLAVDEQLHAQQKQQDDVLIQKEKEVSDVQKDADKETLIAGQLKQLKKVQHNELLQLTFSEQCWTEIFDATGKRLAFNLYKKGALLTVEGRAPFKLKLGDPSVVTIQYQDKKIEREFVTGRTVTFSVPQKL